MLEANQHRYNNLVQREATSILHISQTTHHIVQRTERLLHAVSLSMGSGALPAHPYATPSKWWYPFGLKAKLKVMFIPFPFPQALTNKKDRDQTDSVNSQPAIFHNCMLACAHCPETDAEPDHFSGHVRCALVASTGTLES